MGRNKTLLFIATLLLSLAVRDANALLFSIETDKDEYSSGEDVRIQLKVENNSDKPASLTFPTSQRYDIIITKDGKEVWRWAYEKVFAMALTVLKMKPGEALSFEERWRQTDSEGNDAGPGNYKIKGVLKVKGRPISGTKIIKVR